MVDLAEKNSASNMSSTPQFRLSTLLILVGLAPYMLSIDGGGTTEFGLAGGAGKYEVGSCTRREIHYGDYSAYLQGSVAPNVPYSGSIHYATPKISRVVWTDEDNPESESVPKSPFGAARLTLGYDWGAIQVKAGPVVSSGRPLKSKVWPSGEILLRAPVIYSSISFLMGDPILSNQGFLAWRVGRDFGSWDLRLGVSSGPEETVTSGAEIEYRFARPFAVRAYGNLDLNPPVTENSFGVGVNYRFRTRE